MRYSLPPLASPYSPVVVFNESISAFSILKSFVLAAFLVVLFSVFPDIPSTGVTFAARFAGALVILYFTFTVLTGLTESLREGLLTVFGQKITHALRSSMMEKYTNLTAGELTKQEPGTIVSRFVGDVDTVEHLFTSGIISMFANPSPSEA